MKRPNPVPISRALSAVSRFHRLALKREFTVISRHEHRRRRYCTGTGDSVWFYVLKPAGLFLYPDASAGAAPGGEDLTDGVVGDGGPLWLAVVRGTRRTAARLHASRPSAQAQVQYMGWGATVPGEAGGCVEKGLRALSIKIKAFLTPEEHMLLVG
jgi:hypothetical protein